MARVLTAAAMERFKPTGKRRWVRDGGAQSLYLVIQGSGHKSWVMRFRRPDGKPGKIVLGPVDLSGRELKGEPQIGQPLSLPAARQLAARVHRDRALGHDVVADHKARRHRQRAEIKDRADSAFGTLVRRFIEEHARLKTRQWRSTAMRLGLRYPLDCQSASDRDPRSASKRDPLVLRFERLALAPSELVGIAETGRARVGV